MPFSEFLSSKREDCKKLIRLLSEKYNYASLLGSDTGLIKNHPPLAKTSMKEDS